MIRLLEYFPAAVLVGLCLACGEGGNNPPAPPEAPPAKAEAGPAAEKPPPKAPEKKRHAADFGGWDDEGLSEADRRLAMAKAWRYDAVAFADMFGENGFRGSAKWVDQWVAISGVVNSVADSYVSKDYLVTIDAGPRRNFTCFFKPGPRQQALASLNRGQRTFIFGRCKSDGCFNDCEVMDRQAFDRPRELTSEEKVAAAQAAAVKKETDAKAALDKIAADKAARETAASNGLKLIRLQIKNGRQELAKQTLLQFIKDYADTPSAAEARKLYEETYGK